MLVVVCEEIHVQKVEMIRLGKEKGLEKINFIDFFLERTEL